jgi:hypothetical protein
MHKPLDPIETLAQLQQVVDRMLGPTPLLSDRQIMLAVLRTLADREERRAGMTPEHPDDPHTPTPAA